MVLVVGVAVGIAVLVHGNQLPLFQNLDGFLKRRLLNASVLNDFLVRGPAVSLTALFTMRILPKILTVFRPWRSCSNPKARYKELDGTSSIIFYHL